MAKNEKEQQGTNKQLPYDIAERFTLDGQPIFEYVNIDNQTGKISYKLHPGIEEELKEAQQGAADNIINLIERMIAGNPPYEQLQKWQNTLDTFYKTAIDGAALVDELRDLRPYISAELEKGDYKFLEEYKDRGKRYTLSEILDLLIDPNSDFAPILNAARAARDAADKMPKIRYNAGTDLKASTDKLANLFFSLAAPADIHSGQRTMVNIPRSDMIPLQYENDGAQNITLFYDFTYDEEQLNKLGISKTFDSQDHFLASILDTLYLENNKTVSLTKIWHELCGTGSPSADQLTPIYNRLIRGLSTIIIIDDKDVQEAYGNNPGTKYKEIVSPVMPLQIASEKFKSNGKVANATIKINQLSPFFMLSQSTGQMSEWKKEILHLYSGRKTTRYYSVLQCLMQHISKIRAKGTPPTGSKLPYLEFYNRNKDKSYRAKELTRSMVYRLLDEVFIPAGYVQTYEEDQDGEPGIIIICTPEAALNVGNKLLLDNKQ